FAVCAAAAFIFLVEIVRMLRERESERALYVIAIIIAPSTALLVWRQPFVYPRYFAVCIPLLLILIGRFLARAWNADLLARAACLLFVALFIWGNTRQLKLFFKSGRGQYLAAMHYMSAGGETTVGSLQDLRNEMVFRF